MLMRFMIKQAVEHLKPVLTKSAATLSRAGVTLSVDNSVMDRFGKLLRCTWSWYSGRCHDVVCGQDLLGIIRRDLSGSGLRIIVCKRLLLRELEDRFESQSRASRSGIALGVSPPGVSPQVVDHHLEGATIPRPITMAQRAKQLRQVIGGGHRRLAG